ncbi:MAG: 4Fe-4S binding protein, partial [Bacillota bacterium]
YMLLRMEKWDGYIREGLVSSSSEVSTLKESLERFHRHPHDGTSMVEPFDRAVKVLEEAEIKALVPCSCRLTFGRCRKPLMTCIILGDGAEEMISRGVGREIDVQEAESVLAVAHREALVHLVLYRPGGPYGVCSCCACCCHDLQAFKLHGRKNWILPASYVATQQPGLCSGCGSCIKVCAFEARKLSGDQLLYDPEKCYGCGVCVHVCPEGAIRLVSRAVNNPSWTGDAPKRRRSG